MSESAPRPQRLRSRRRAKLITAAASHAFLVLVALTMAAPFLWMLSTALKPPGQVQKANWIPTREFARLDGAEREVLQRSRAADGAGIYRVRVISLGPRRGEVREVSTNDLTPELARADRFALRQGAGEAAQVLTVELVAKVKPETWEVRLAGAGGAETRRLPETDVVAKPSLRWENFRKAWTISGVFGRAFVNSLLIATLATIGQVFTSSLAAYAFARLEFRGRRSLFLAYLATLMIPGAVTMIPLFVLLKALPGLLNGLLATDWFSSQLFVRWWLASPVREFYAGKVVGLDSYFALIAPGLFSAYGTFLLRQFFLTIPRDLEDAARIDGCGHFGVYWRVVLPLAKPALATLAILTFMAHWRDFMWPMVVTSSPEMQTLPVMLQAFMGATGTQWELLMAATLIVMAPMILVFVLGQKFFISGIRLGALKG